MDNRIQCPDNILLDYMDEVASYLMEHGEESYSHWIGEISTRLRERQK